MNERVYELTAHDFRIDYRNRSAPFRRALQRTARLMLQRATREIEASIDARHAFGTEGDAPYRLGRDVVCLSDADLGELQRRMREIHEWLGSVDRAGNARDPDDPGSVVSLTWTLCTLAGSD